MTYYHVVAESLKVHIPNRIQTVFKDGTRGCAKSKPHAYRSRFTQLTSEVSHVDVTKADWIVAASYKSN